MQTVFIFLTAMIIGIPGCIYAAAPSAPTDFASLVAFVTDILKTLVILIFALTFLVFIWGIIKNWILKGGSDEGAENGKKVVVAGIVGFVVMVSIWGILSLLQSSIFGQ